MRQLFRALMARLPLQTQAGFLHAQMVASRLPHKARVIVSLSTLPDRIANLGPTLQCLIRQTRPPDEIVIAIPPASVRQQTAYSIPTFLRELPLVRILHCERDWGPATKFIPSIQEELAASRPETLVVVVDDDRIYPRDAIETFLHYQTSLPNAALCFRGAAMPRSFDWREAKMLHGHNLRRPGRVAVITGCGSYLVQPKFFDASLWDYSGAPPAAFYMDDIWISGCLDRASVKKYVVPCSAKLRSVKAQTATMNLHDVPNGRQPNNNQVIEFFRERWDVFGSPRTIR